MKVIFLDIDGVMNSEEHALELRDLMMAGKIEKDAYYHDWDLPCPKALEALNKIIKATDAKIVLSSTWRLNPDRVKRLNEIFSQYNFAIFDCTTTANITKVTLENKLNFSFKNCYSTYKHDGVDLTDDRGAQIAYWLYKHPETTGFVILDDDSADIDNYYKDKHVKTIFKTGLTEKNADKAISILMR